MRGDKISFLVFMALLALTFFGCHKGISPGEGLALPVSTTPSSDLSGKNISVPVTPSVLEEDEDSTISGKVVNGGDRDAPAVQTTTTFPTTPASAAIPSTPAYNAGLPPVPPIVPIVPLVPLEDDPIEDDEGDVEACVNDNDCVSDDTCPCVQRSCIDAVCVSEAVLGCAPCKHNGNCNDSNSCTLDRCHEGQCVYTPIQGCAFCRVVSDCPAAPACTTTTCIANACTYTLNPNCSTLLSIAITPADPKINAAATQRFVATGTYSDPPNSQVNLTSYVTWSSSDLSVATISNLSESKGIATGIKAGSATITASFSNIVGSTSLTVEASNKN